MNPVTFVSMSTVRVTCWRNGELSSVGTGFFYCAEIETAEGVVPMPLVITNKHVVEGYSEIRLVLTLSPNDTEPPDCVVSESDVQKTYVISDLEQRLIFHPDAEVDLCAFFVQDIDVHIADIGLRMRHSYLEKRLLVRSASRVNIRAVEPILMLGYPNGLWDRTNNRPLARRGSTASHPFINWNGRREFVIDAACFPGSSGSPVFLFEEPLYRTDDNSHTPGTRVQLLGVLASGPTIDRVGRLIQRDIPTSTVVPVVSDMMNLGNVVHADAILDIECAVAEAALQGKTFNRAVVI